jgi:hypothetical protein
MEMMGKLAQKQGRGDKEIRDPSRYVTRWWTNARRDAFEDLKEYDDSNPALSSSGDIATEAESASVNLENKSAYEQWKIAQRAKDEPDEYEEDVRLDRFAKLPLLSDDLQDVVGMHIAGILKLISKFGRVSVSRRLARS